MSVVPPAGRHGGDASRIAEALGVDPATMLDLSHTLNPIAPDPAPVVARHLAALGRYPDPRAATALLARTIDVTPDELLLTNGGSEAIALAASLFEAGEVASPEFSLYERHLPRLEQGAPRFASNPNNPTGLLADPTATAAVWDEAFHPLATGTWTRGDHRRGSIVLGSLTKLLACPGLRLGYVLADPGTIARLALRQPEWSVNGVALAALGDLLEPVELADWATRLAARREALTAVLESHGVEVRPSDSPWVLVDRPGLREDLAIHGVVVRDCSSFGLPGVHRLSVTTDDGLARLDDALSRISPTEPAPPTEPAEPTESEGTPT